MKKMENCCIRNGKQLSVDGMTSGLELWPIISIIVVSGAK